MDESHDAVQGPQFRHAGSVRGLSEGIRTIEENSDAIVLESTAGNDGREQYQSKALQESELSGSGSIDENGFDMLAQSGTRRSGKAIEFVVLTATPMVPALTTLKAGQSEIGVNLSKRLRPGCRNKPRQKKNRRMKKKSRLPRKQRRARIRQA